MKCPPLQGFFGTEFFMATVLQLKVAKMRLFEKESLERCMRCGNMSASTSYYWFLLLLLISVVNFLCQSCSLVMQNQLLCDNQVKAALYLKCKLKTYFMSFVLFICFIADYSHGWFPSNNFHFNHKNTTHHSFSPDWQTKSYCQFESAGSCGGLLHVPYLLAPSRRKHLLWACPSDRL